MEDFLSIVEKKEDILIDVEKLRFLAPNVDIWDHFGVTRSQYVALNADEKSKMLKGYYRSLVPVYLGEGKKSILFSDFVWFNDGKKQYCLRCGVNVMACSCFEFPSAPKQLSNELNMQSVESMFKKQDEDLFNRENGNKSGFGIGISHIRKLVGDNKKLKT